jgi:hypothetical protein
VPDIGRHGIESGIDRRKSPVVPAVISSRGLDGNVLPLERALTTIDNPLPSEQHNGQSHSSR